MKHATRRDTGRRLTSPTLKLSLPVTLPICTTFAAHPTRLMLLKTRPAPRASLPPPAPPPPSPLPDRWSRTAAVSSDPASPATPTLPNERGGVRMIRGKKGVSGSVVESTCPSHKFFFFSYVANRRVRLQYQCVVSRRSLFRRRLATCGAHAFSFFETNVSFLVTAVIFTTAVSQLPRPKRKCVKTNVTKYFSFVANFAS